MTNGWTDIQNADVILAMGGNPAENHPVGFRFVMEAKRNRNAKLVSVDPRFNRTAAVADSFTQIRTGTDIAFLGGLINYALTRNRIHADYVRLFTNATFLVREDYSFNEQEGLFSGWNPEKKTYDKSSWNYELDAKGFAKVDETMQHPRCVFQIMKTFYSRYTPEMVSSICGCRKQDFLKAYLDVVTPKPLRPNSMNFWSNTDRFFVSQMKAYYGKAATKQNDFAYHWHPKLPQTPAGGYENWSWAFIFDHMYNGKMEGFFSFGMNPVNNGPNSSKAVAALSKLKWLVVAENFEQETAGFWRREILEVAKKKPEDVKTEVFLLPAANFAEKDGCFTNSARWIQWKWKAVDPPGEAKADQEIIGRIFLKVRELYKKEGGKFPDPVLNLNWWYSNPSSPSQVELCKEINGWAIEDLKDEKDPKTIVLKAGQQVGKFLDLRADGSTLSGDWLHIGMYTEAGNLTPRRNNADPSGLGRYPEWTFNWPANRRVMYNRCSADAQGKPWYPTRPGIVWNGEKWVRAVPG